RTAPGTRPARTSSTARTSPSPTGPSPPTASRSTRTRSEPDAGPQRSPGARASPPQRLRRRGQVLGEPAAVLLGVVAAPVGRAAAAARGGGPAVAGGGEAAGVGGRQRPRGRPGFGPGRLHPRGAPRRDEAVQRRTPARRDHLGPLVAIERAGVVAEDFRRP